MTRRIITLSRIPNKEIQRLGKTKVREGVSFPFVARKAIGRRNVLSSRID